MGAMGAIGLRNIDIANVHIFEFFVSLRVCVFKPFLWRWWIVHLIMGEVTREMERYAGVKPADPINERLDILV